MNIWALLYFSAFIFYIYSGFYVLKLNRKAMVNVLFFVMCLTLSAWAFGYSFSTGASRIEEALAWRGLSTLGWTFFYSNLLLFIAAITKSRFSPKNFKWSYLIYVPSLLFFLRFLTYDTGSYQKSPFGWVYLLYYKGPWSYAFDLFYLLCVISSFILLFFWKHKTESLRERKQVQIIISSMLGAFVLGGTTDTFLPLFGVKVLPMGILFSSIAVSGMWVAITKYKMMNLTQEIAAEHVLVTMKDPVIILSPQYHIGQINKATIELCGYEQSELVGEAVQIIVPEFEINHIVLSELNRQGYTNGYEIQMLSKDGNWIPCLCSGVYVMSDFGEQIGLILVLHDITNRKEREKLLNRVNEDLQTKITKINNVFDNVREGILTFNDDFTIHHEYSFECQRLFNGPIENLHFSEAIYPENLEMQKFTNALLTRIFAADDHMRSLYMPLLPEHVLLYGSNVTIQYKFTVDSNKNPMMMAIISDNSEKVQLENQRDVERKTLRMVVSAVLNREDFIELVEDFKTFVNEELAHTSTNTKQFLSRLHTFKGNFSQFDMLHLVNHLHQLEEWLLSRSHNQTFQLQGEELLQWLDEDLTIIEEIVGCGYFDGDHRITVERTKLEHLRNQILQKVDPSISGTLSDQISCLYNKPLHDLLANYPEYTIRLGERWHKKIAPFTIEGDLIYVNPTVYQNVFKSIVHVFRNAVAHGIETEDERLEQGKSIEGHILCKLKALNDAIVISIGDDGRGINPLDVAYAAIGNGLITHEILSEMEDSELLQLIYAEHLTTTESADQLSGRGIGLTAVKDALDQIGGSIVVTSEVGKGTQFEIFLPKL